MLEVTDSGAFVAMSGWIKTDGAEGDGAGLWIGVYMEVGEATDTLGQTQWRSGTSDWETYRVLIEVPAEGVREICYGPILYRPGTAWFDELEIAAV